MIVLTAYDFLTHFDSNVRPKKQNYVLTAYDFLTHFDMKKFYRALADACVLTAYDFLTHSDVTAFYLDGTKTTS